jgi:hypothetical protein
MCLPQVSGRAEPALQSQRESTDPQRQLLTRWGEVPLRWPRFVCECGGSITLDLADWLRPYQRIGSDVDAQIQRWGALGVSLPAMQRELAHSYIGVLGQRTLLKRLHQLQNLTPGADERPTPPILQLDAIGLRNCVPPANGVPTAKTVTVPSRAGASAACC